MAASDSYPVSGRNKVRRMPERGHYDAETIHAMLDATMLCHVGYVVDGQPYCTPTLFWRRGNRVIWHGSAASRMLREQVKQIDVCLTVTFLDGLVLTRTAFSHAVNYRSAMIFGKASLIDDPEEKRRTADELIDTFFPGRSGLVVPATPAELKQASFLTMPIDQASAKIRNFPATHEAPEHRNTPVWAGEIPIRLTIGEAVPCSNLDPGIAKGADLSRYREGASLDATLLEIRRLTIAEFDRSVPPQCPEVQP
jgi:nitroimidazol reductase NimA-like FMN-containing flavoprotein (pyridoxamine 5'-phosphate oxidase superfamily)